MNFPSSGQSSIPYGRRAKRETRRGNERRNALHSRRASWPVCLARQFWSDCGSDGTSGEVSGCRSAAAVPPFQAEVDIPLAVHGKPETARKQSGLSGKAPVMTTDGPLRGSVGTIDSTGSGGV